MCVVSGGDCNEKPPLPLSRKGRKCVENYTQPILQGVELPGVYCPDKNYKDSNLTVYDWLHFRRKCSQIGHKGKNKTL